MPLTTYAQPLVTKHVAGIESYTMPTGLKVHFHTGDPGAAGTSNEVNGSGNGYTSKSLTYQWDGTNFWAENNAVIEIDNMPAVTVTHFSVSDGSNNRLYYEALAAPVPLNAGSTLRVKAEDLKLKAI